MVFTPPNPLNVASRLVRATQATPNAVAVVEPLGYGADRKRSYRHITFRELDQDSDRIALDSPMGGAGETPGLAVRPGIDFISLVFGLLKVGAVAILIDPGMGRRNLVRCLAETVPEGFIAIPMAQAVRALRGLSQGPPECHGGAAMVLGRVYA